MVVAVTGASGHIGGVLCRQLLDRGDTVRALVYRDDRALRDVDVECVRGDVLDRETLRPLVDGADRVFHLAAVISIEGDPTGTVHATNVTGTRNLAEACLAAHTPRLVHFSSIHAFEQAPVDEVLDESRGHVGTFAFAYDRSKSAGEREIRRALDKGLDAVIVNPTAVIGPFDFKPSRMGDVFRKLARGAMPALVKGGFDWVDVRDVARSALVAAERGRKGLNYLLPGRWLSMRDLAAAAARHNRRPAPRVVIPVTLAKIGLPLAWLQARLTGANPVYTNESLEIVAHSSRNVSPSRARADLGHESRPIDETVADVYKWLSADERDRVSIH